MLGRIKLCQTMKMPKKKKYSANSLLLKVGMAKKLFSDFYSKNAFTKYLDSKWISQKTKNIYRFAHKSMSKIAIREKVPGTRWDGTGQLTEINGIMFFRKSHLKTVHEQ